MKNYKIISWNVNGIRAIMKKDFLKDIKEMSPDIICLQETKASEIDAIKAIEVMEGYHIYINSSKEKKGYSGTAILSKEKPINVTNDIGIEIHDKEGRVICAEYENFNLVNVYVPNSGQELKRLDYGVKLYEPLIALKAGTDGLSEINKIILKSKELLKENGKLIFEIGQNQKNKIIKLLNSNGFYINKICKDLQSYPRVIISTKLT